MKYNRLRENVPEYQSGATDRTPVVRKAPLMSAATILLFYQGAAMLLSVVLLSLVLIGSAAALTGKGSERVPLTTAGVEQRDGYITDSLSKMSDFSNHDRSYSMKDNRSLYAKYTDKTYEHDVRFADKKMIYGIDVSRKQNGIDWIGVREDGIQYAMIRAGYRGYSEGQLHKDKNFGRNIHGASAVGMRIGAYVYSQAITEEEILQEARLLLECAAKADISMPLVLDYEFADVGAGVGGRLHEAKLSVEDATNMCLLFCRTISDAGYRPMIYANSYMLKNRLDAQRLSEAAEIWIAYPDTTNGYESDYSMWQYSWSGRVRGISGVVDCNFYYE